MNKDELILDLFSLIRNHQDGDMETFEKMDETFSKGVLIGECLLGDSSQEPIINYAISYMKSDIASYLLDKGADPFQGDIHGYNLIHIISLKHNDLITNDLEYYSRIFRYVIESSERPLDLIRSTTDNGVTALHFLMNTGDFNLDSIKYCIENGADINAIDTDGNTPLHYAIDNIKDLVSSNHKGCIKFVEVFLENKADIKVKNDKGESFAGAMDELKDSENNAAVRELADLIEYKTVTEIEIEINNRKKNKIKAYMRNRPKIGGLKK